MSFTDSYEDVQDDGPVGYGQVTNLDGAEDRGPVLAVDEYAAYMVPVRVDGEEIMVPLSEAVQGYQRQADYTRKTQEVAQQRQELQVVAAIKQALESDPTGTIQALSDHYNVATTSVPPSQGYDDDWSYGTTEQDPRFSQLEQRVAAFERQQAQAQLDAEIGRLQSKYGESFSAQEVLAQAVALGNSDLEQVYKLTNFDRIVEVAQARHKEASKTQKTVEAKKAAQVVSSGGSAGSRAVVDTPIRSIREAWAAAKADQGV